MPQQARINRRDSLAVGSALLLTSSVMGGRQQAGWIDCHSHIWSQDTERFPLAPGLTKDDLDPPSFTDNELMAVATPEGVDRVVLIQHSIYHRFDNAYLTDAVKRHPRRFRVVGMLDDLQPNAGAAMRALLPKGVTGFRITPFIREKQSERWLDSPGMHEMWQTGSETQQAMCCLINPEDLPGVQQMCRRYPQTPVVIDHFARIGAAGQVSEADLNNLLRLQQYTKVTIKISAYYALGQKKPPHLELVPMIKRLYESFGPERLMWGSDAPYQLEGENSYGESIRLVRDRLDFATPEDKQWLLQKTAERVFFYA